MQFVIDCSAFAAMVVLVFMDGNSSEDVYYGRRFRSTAIL